MAKHVAVVLLLLLALCQIQSIFGLHDEDAANCKPHDANELFHCIESSKENLTIELEYNQTYSIKQNIVIETAAALSINGNHATIQCMQKSIGLILHSKTLIAVEDLTITSCGMVQNSTTNTEVMAFTVAVYIAKSSQVALNGMKVINSSGYGMALINSSEFVVIRNSGFEGSHSKGDFPGGGGLYIEQVQTPVSISITGCSFSHNNASTGRYRAEDYPAYKTSPLLLFGRGGGISINLLSCVVDVSLSHCWFENNRGDRGGGLFLFSHGSGQSLFNITDCNFTSNQCTVRRQQESIFSAGGGLAILSTSNDSKDQSFIRGCNFTGNTAYYGGGVSIATTKNGQVLIEESVFVNNGGKIGSAMDLFCYSILQSCDDAAVPEIRSVNFSNNGGFFTYLDKKERTFATIHVEDHKVNFSGKVVITDNKASGIALENGVMDIMSDSSILIQNNVARNGGGIQVQGKSVIYLREGVELSFVENMATERGGGIYVKQSERFFSVYSYSCFVTYNSSTDSTIMTKHPNDWKANITFSSNTANGKPNALFATSIYPCVYPSNNTMSDTELKSQILSTFCNWTSWHFVGECSALIGSLPQMFSQENYGVVVYPEMRKEIKGLSVFDDFYHDITNSTIFVTYVLSNDTGVAETYKPDLNRNSILISGDGSNERRTFQVLVETAYHRSVSTIVDVTVLECPVGYVVDGNKGCKCSFQGTPILECNNDYNISVFIGHCVGYDSNYSLVYSKCPFTAANPFHPRVPISHGPRNFNNKFCENYNRSGFLCQDCIENYGINVFSLTYDCIECNNTCYYVNWIKAIAVVVGPQTLFFLTIIVFHIGITAPSMTAYIFFSHVITLPLEIILVRSAWTLELKKHHHHFISVLTDIMASPYRIWSFDFPEIFHMQVCLSPNLKIMHAIAFRYLHALYPIILLVTALVLIELHARNCKPIVFLWKPLCFLCVRLRRKWQIKTSVIDAFATVILLSYSKIINTSLYLLTRNYVKNPVNDLHVETRLDYDTSVIYFHHQHVIFAAVAIVMLCTFGSIPPLLLLVYPSRFFFKLLTVIRLDHWHGLHVFIETFQGSFKNGTNRSPERRWFAGVYFLFRITVFVVFALTDDLIKLHFNLAITFTVFLFCIVFLKPYKKEFYNYLDASFMGILVVVNCCMVYCATFVQINRKLPIVVWRLTYVLLLVPTGYLITYLVYLFFTRSRSTFIQNYCISGIRRLKQRTVTYLANTQNTYERLTDNDTYSIISDGPTHSSLDNFSDAPDRVDNPQRYYNMEWSHQLDRTSISVVSVDREKDREELRARQIRSA